MLKSSLEATWELAVLFAIAVLLKVIRQPFLQCFFNLCFYSAVVHFREEKLQEKLRTAKGCRTFGIVAVRRLLDQTVVAVGLVSPLSRSTFRFRRISTWLGDSLAGFICATDPDQTRPGGAIAAR